MSFGGCTRREGVLAEVVESMRKGLGGSRTRLCREGPNFCK